MASHVVIGYDGSEASDDAVAFGLTWSRSTGDVPIIATVYPGEHAFGVGRVDADWAGHVREQAQIVQNHARAMVGDAALYHSVPSTSAAHGLSDLAEDAEAVLVIVGTTRVTGLTRALLGSSTERLFTRCGGAGRGCAAGVAAVSPGLDLAHRGGLHRYLGRPGGVADGGAGCPANPGPADALHGSRPILGALFLSGRQDGRAGVLEHGARRLPNCTGLAAAGVPPELEPRTVLLEGAVVESLAALGPNDVDVLVCGSRGYGPVRRVLLGGVSAPLIRRARVPVAVVPRATTAFAE